MNLFIFLLTTDKVAIKREQRLLAGSAERSNFNKVNRRKSAFGVRIYPDGVRCLLSIYKVRKPP